MLIKGGRDARYSPTGHLLYVQNGVLLAVPFDSDTFTISQRPVSLIEGIASAAVRTGTAHFNVSSNGTLAYVSEVSLSRSRSALVWVDRNGQMTQLHEGEGEYRHPRLAPDGRRVAFSLVQGNTADIWLYDIERESPERLTFGGRNAYPIWTPDGKRITFGSGSRSGGFDLFWQVIDGSAEAEQLRESGATNSFPGSWSPDGSMLAFHEANENMTREDLWIRPKEGQASVFLATEFVELTPQVSPDGQWVAYVSNQTGEPRVFVQPFPDGGRVIPVSAGAGTEPVWSRDRTQLFFRDDTQMMVVQVQLEPTFAAERPEVLFEGPYDLDPILLGTPNYDSALDGRFLMVTAGEGVPAPQINVVLNWFDELQRLVPTP